MLPYIEFEELHRGGDNQRRIPILFPRVGSARSPLPVQLLHQSFASGRTRISFASKLGHDDVQIVCGISTMTKLLDRALEAARDLPPDAQDDIAHVVFAWPVPTMSRRCRSRPKSKPRSLPQRLPLPVANLRPMSRCGQSGPNTVCEAALYPSGACRSQRDPRLHRRPFTAARTAGSGPHQSPYRSSVAASPHWPPHERSGYPPDDHGALPLSGSTRRRRPRSSSTPSAMRRVTRPTCQAPLDQPLCGGADSARPNESRVNSLYGKFSKVEKKLNCLPTI